MLSQSAVITPNIKLPKPKLKGKKLLDPKASAREKIDIILPPIVKFNEIVKIGRL